MHSPLSGQTRAGAARPSLRTQLRQFFPLFNTAWTANSRTLSAHASLTSRAPEKVWNTEASTTLGGLPGQTPETAKTNLASEHRPTAAQPHSGRQEEADAPFFSLFPLTRSCFQKGFISKQFMSCAVIPILKTLVVSYSPSFHELDSNHNLSHKDVLRCKLACQTVALRCRRG